MLPAKHYHFHVLPETAGTPRLPEVLAAYQRAIHTPANRVEPVVAAICGFTHELCATAQFACTAQLNAFTRELARLGFVMSRTARFGDRTFNRAYLPGLGCRW
jgi:hypothetical protein